MKPSIDDTYNCERSSFLNSLRCSEFLFDNCLSSFWYFHLFTLSVSFHSLVLSDLILRLLSDPSIFSFVMQEGETAQADKHADIAIDADRYNPAGMLLPPLGMSFPSDFIANFSTLSIHGFYTFVVCLASKSDWMK